MNVNFKFDNNRFFCGYNCNEAKIGDKGIFFNFFDITVEKIITGDFYPEEIFELAKIKETQDHKKSFCFIDENGKEIWFDYFYRFENKETKRGLCDGYTHYGGVCCRTCQYGKYKYSDDKTDNLFYCFRKHSKGVWIEGDALCYFWKRREGEKMMVEQKGVNRVNISVKETTV